jgi:long-chain-fatty-acid--[acyl-carrier-protein] ligase
MLRLLRNILWVPYWLIVSLRYHTHLHGTEQLRDLHGPVLILPNHPTRMDPSVVVTALWPWLHPRPVLYEGNFQNLLFYPVMLLLGAIRVPDLSRASSKAQARAEQAVAEVIAALRGGDNVIIWPSGRTQRDGVERLGGARAVADILKAVPQAQAVLVRTRGLWGSRFSAAYTGTLPNLFRELWVSAGLLLANLLVFMPRRRVDVSVRRVDRGELPAELKRETLNPRLEKWYNAAVGPEEQPRTPLPPADPPGQAPSQDADLRPETPTFVPYHFVFGKRTHDFPSRLGPAEAHLGGVKPETMREVEEIVAHKLHRRLTETEKGPETTLDQLGLDSLDQMDVALDIERQFGFSGDEVPRTLGELAVLAQGLAEKKPPRPAPRAWFRPPADEAAAITGDTVAEAFVNRALANPGDVAAADDVAGAVTCGRLLAGALTLSRRFAPLPGDHVGLLLPASVACDMAFLGLQLAGKVPVVLNWTTGQANLAHATRLLGLTHVVTSNQFIDRTRIQIRPAAAEASDPSGDRAGVIRIESTPVCLEDLSKDVGKVEKARAFLLVRLLPGRVRRLVPRPDPDRPAVVLFTSGSEKAPKAVPLTHRNLLSDQRACVEALGLSRRDGVLGFLPAFHSFGLSVTGLLPLLAGLRVVHHPDPTAAAALARKVGTYRPTVLAGTPTFVPSLLDRAGAGQLESLRMIVVGAEKCPDDLRTRCAERAPAAALLEGYGITECSPVVSVNRPSANRKGTVGQPIPGVEVCVTDPDSGAVLPAGKMGMLEVSGPTVFPGYVGYDGPSPFRERDGKRWYVTGDLGQLDADSFITLSGRLKRFLKAGGEMISLEALEGPFAERYPPVEDRHRVAVEGVELEGGGRRVALFATEAIALREANDLLREKGFTGVMRLDEVRRVEEIPVLGSGKIDRKALKAQLAEAGQPAGAGAG